MQQATRSKIPSDPKEPNVGLRIGVIGEEVIGYWLLVISYWATQQPITNN